ncbi:WD40-repeat-containing domain protein [Cytidiella melzeri]|nr:WD40-repeat-containing domain protein [Cytidiella melzeri]
MAATVPSTSNMTNSPTAAKMTENTSTTLYMPIASPPTPAPSPGPGSPRFPSIASLSRQEFSILPPAQRRQYLCAILNDCTPDELSFVSTTIASLLKRDFLRDLPPELAIYILSFLNEPKALLRAGLVSRYWFGLVADDWLWKHLSFTHGFVGGTGTHESTSSEDPQIPSQHTVLPPAASSYRARFKTAFITLSNWRHGGTLLRRILLASQCHLPNDAMQPPIPNPSAAVPTSIALDSEWLVIGLANSRIHIFSARTGVSCRTLVGHTAGVWAVALVKGGGENVDLLDVADSLGNMQVSEQLETSSPRDMSKGLDQYLSSAMRGALGLEHFPKNHRQTAPLPTNNPSSKGADRPSDPSGTADGWGQPNSLVVSGGCDKDLRVWDVKSGFCIYVLKGHTSTIRCLKVLHNRPIAVTGSRDRTLRVWDIQRGRLLRVLEGHEQSVRSLDVCGSKVVSGSYDSTCRLWDIDTGDCIHILRGHFHQIYTVAFDGVRIVSGGMDTTVRVWDAETGTCTALLQGHTALVCQVQLSPTMLVTGGSDGRVISFSLAPPPDPARPSVFMQRLVPHDSSVTGLQFDERFLVTGGNDGRVRLFEYKKGGGGGGSAATIPGDDVPGNFEYVRELSEASESVWKIAYSHETCAVVSKRAGKTQLEIWSFKPKEEETS